MQMKERTIAAALVATTVISVPVWAVPTMPHHRVSNANLKWLMAAADGELKEISLGHLVSQRSNDAGVKRFALKMVQDHTKAQGELQNWRSRKASPCPRI